MTNNVTVFNYEDSKLNVIMIENEPWFIGKEVAIILGYATPQKALRDHVDEEDKQLVDRSIFTNGVSNTGAEYPHTQNAVYENGLASTVPERNSTQNAVSGINTQITIINESGLYSLILSSRLESAKKFKRWVTSEVLPSIRKVGSYTARQLSTTPTPNLTQMVIDAGELSKALIEYYNVLPSIAKVHSLTLTGKFYNTNLDDVKKILPPAEDYETEVTFNPTQLAEKLTELTGKKTSNRQINSYLLDMELQTKTSDGYTLTDKGKQYATMTPYERNGHTGFQIKWKSSILQALSEYLTQN